MIVRNQQEVTEAVLADLSRGPHARFREIVSAAVRHFHGFARDARDNRIDMADCPDTSRAVRADPTQMSA